MDESMFTTVELVPTVTLSSSEGGSGTSSATGSSAASSLGQQADLTANSVGVACQNQAVNKVKPPRREPMLSLILRAFKSTTTGRMPVDEIYEFVLQHSRPEEYTRKEDGWHHNVRHILTKKEKLFKLTDVKSKVKGKKGFYWQFLEMEHTSMDLLHASQDNTSLQVTF